MPRPAEARPGAPAPWDRLQPDARRGLDATLVRGRLESAGQGGAPPAIERWTGEPGAVLVEAWNAQAAVPSAVLVALFEEDGETRVVLTRRSTALREHSGQISFPGGRMEPGEGVWEAAGREAAEEVGMDPEDLAAVGWLHPVTTYSSRSLILPVVGLLPGRPDLEGNPHEVARVFDVSLAELAAEGAFTEELWRIPALEGRGQGGDYAVYFYDVADENVWGATARMLTELLVVALGLAGPAEVTPPGP